MALLTIKDYTTTFRHYGEITVPALTPVTHRTATGFDPKINFVSSFKWVDRKYPEIANILKMDLDTYGLDIPAEYVQEMQTVDITPTWSEVLKPMLDLYVQTLGAIENDTSCRIDPTTAENKKLLEEQFVSMAKAADRWNEHTKNLTEEVLKNKG